MNKFEIIAHNICEIIKEKNTFITLNDIYLQYKAKYDISFYKDYKSVIRKVIYSRCIDRDLLDKSKKPLFFSLSPRKTKGNQYGLLEWSLDSTLLDISSNEIDEIVNRIPEIPVFDDVILEEAPSNELTKTYKYRLRRRCMMAQALINANYNCEEDENHPSFIRKSNNKNYTETHHLIPLQYQYKFKYSLDIPANIISLCSNCHNQLHYGKYKDCILKNLYNARITELKKFGIEIEFDDLLQMYK